MSNVISYAIIYHYNTPSHVIPSPKYPVLHLHVNEPSVFVQAAFASQLSVADSHSSISKKICRSSVNINARL